jgi:hypothetical protein
MMRSWLGVIWFPAPTMVASAQRAAALEVNAVGRAAWASEERGSRRCRSGRSNLKVRQMRRPELRLAVTERRGR